METENIILEHLRAIRATLDRHSEDLREIRVRLERLCVQASGLSQGFACLDRKLARIEKRLDLVET